MGGAKSNVRQHWEMASNDYNLTYDWRSSTYDKSKLTLTKNGKNCWTLRKPSGEDYSISYKNFSLCFNGGWKEKDTFLILMHFTKDDVGNYRYEAFKTAFGENWTTNTMICDTAGNSHGNRRLVNYNDERHELTWMIQLTAFSGVIAFYYDFWGVDQVTIAALSENDYSRLLQVPYGYKGNYIFCGVGTSVQKDNKVYINTAIVNKNLFKASVGGGQSFYVKVYWDGTNLKVTADSTTQPSASWPSTKDSFGVYVSPNGNWIVDEIYEPYGIYKLKEN